MPQFFWRQATSAEATRTLGADNVDAATCAAIDSSFSTPVKSDWAASARSAAAAWTAPRACAFSTAAAASAARSAAAVREGGAAATAANVAVASAARSAAAVREGGAAAAAAR